MPKITVKLSKREAIMVDEWFSVHWHKDVSQKDHVHKVHVGIDVIESWLRDAFRLGFEAGSGCTHIDDIDKHE